MKQGAFLKKFNLKLCNTRQRLLSNLLYSEFILVPRGWFYTIPFFFEISSVLTLYFYVVSSHLPRRYSIFISSTSNILIEFPFFIFFSHASSRFGRSLSEAFHIFSLEWPIQKFSALLVKTWNAEFYYRLFLCIS